MSSPVNLQTGTSYSHHQFSIAALVVSAFVITTGLAIFWDSVNTAPDVDWHHEVILFGDLPSY